MTPEERAKDARRLAARIREQIERYELIEGETVGVTPEDKADR